MVKGAQVICQEIGCFFKDQPCLTHDRPKNVEFPCACSVKCRTRATDRAAAMLGVVLADASTRFPAEKQACSAGIARAIAMNPKYLFCDEPNSGWTPRRRCHRQSDFRHHVKYQITTVVSHDMNSVMEASDTIHFVHQGSICWHGNREGLLEGGVKELEDFVFASDLMRKIRKTV